MVGKYTVPWRTAVNLLYFVSVSEIGMPRMEQAQLPSFYAPDSLRITALPDF